MATGFHQVLLIALLLALAPLARGQTLEVLNQLGTFQTNGFYPRGPLAEGHDGNFYGTTHGGGGVAELGTVFRITPTGEWTTIVSFTGTNGAHPEAGVVRGPDGNFYGTTYKGGSNNVGTVFKVAPEGTLTTLHTFHHADGAYPTAELLNAGDGTFYGTTLVGGNGYGTVFKISSIGDFDLLFAFPNDDTGHPSAPLVFGTNSNFLYGTTQGGFRTTNGCGIVFRLDTNGVFTTLATFPNNGRAEAGLVKAEDGCFYGATVSDGTLNDGTLFKITLQGILTTLVSFNGTNGKSPLAELIQAADGDLYGTTYGGGAYDSGTVFKTTPNGKLTTLVSFVPYPLDPDTGQSPRAALLRATDGNLYGTTGEGGDHGVGTFFRIVMPVSLNLRVSGNELVLSWPTNHVGFMLQSAADLISPTNWIDFTNAPAVVGAQFTVTNSVSGSSQFYRLKKP